MIYLVRNSILFTINLSQCFFGSSIYFKFKYINCIRHLYYHVSPANGILYFYIYVLTH